MTRTYWRIGHLGSLVMAVGATALMSTAPIAAADPILPTAGAQSASTAIDELHNAGYDVEINWLQGHPNVPLSECAVNGVHNPNGPMEDLAPLSTVYLDVTCPNAK